MLTQVSEWRDGKILLEEGQQTHRFQIGNPTQIFPSHSIRPQSFLQVNTFCTELTTFVKQPFFTPIELECDHLSWQLSDDDQWSLASSDAHWKLKKRQLQTETQSWFIPEPNMGTSWQVSLTLINRCTSSPSATVKQQRFKCYGLNQSNNTVCKAWWGSGERPQSAGNEQTPINLSTSESNFHDNG